MNIGCKSALSAVSCVAVGSSLVAGMQVSAANKDASNAKASSSWPEWLWGGVAATAASALAVLINAVRKFGSEGNGSSGSKNKAPGICKVPGFFETGQRVELEQLLAETPESEEQQKKFYEFYRYGDEGLGTKEVLSELEEAESRLEKLNEIYELILSDEKYRELYDYTRRAKDAFNGLPREERARFVKDNLLKNGMNTDGLCNFEGDPLCSVEYERFDVIYARVLSFFDLANEYLVLGQNPEDVRKLAEERDKLGIEEKNGYDDKNFKTGEAVNVSVACSKLHDPTHGSCQLVRDIDHKIILEPLALTIEFLERDVSKLNKKDGMFEFLFNKLNKKGGMFEFLFNKLNKKDDMFEFLFKTRRGVIEKLQDLEYYAYGPQFYTKCYINGKYCSRNARRHAVNSDWYSNWNKLNIKEAMDELIDNGILDIKKKTDDGRGCCRFGVKCDK